MLKKEAINENLINESYLITDLIIKKLQNCILK